jgi:hypothetical protein
MSWRTVKREQGVRGMVELQRYESGKGRHKFVSWQILCEGVKVDYASVERDVEPNFQKAVAGCFRYGPECAAGQSCSGAAFPGHPAHAVDGRA